MRDSLQSTSLGRLQIGQSTAWAGYSWAGYSSGKLQFEQFGQSTVSVRGSLQFQGGAVYSFREGQSTAWAVYSLGSLQLGQSTAWEYFGWGQCREWL